MTSEPAPVEALFEMNPRWLTAGIRAYSRLFASIRGLNTSPPPRTSFVVEPESRYKERFCQGFPDS
jgi:hypothetical protein